MSWEHHGGRVRAFIGDATNKDDPRGRSLGGGIDLGVVTGEFGERGSWGVWAGIWNFGVALMFAGPVLGSYPPEEDEGVGTPESRTQ